MTETVATAIAHGALLLVITNTTTFPLSFVWLGIKEKR